jgi:hypothetical protein
MKPWSSLRASIPGICGVMSTRMEPTSTPALLGRESRRAGEVLDVGPPITLGLVDIPMLPLADQGVEAIPPRIGRQRLGGLRSRQRRLERF